MKFMKLTRLTGERVYLSLESLVYFEPRKDGGAYVHTKGHNCIPVKETCEQILSTEW